MKQTVLTVTNEKVESLKTLAIARQRNDVQFNKKIAEVVNLLTLRKTYETTDDKSVNFSVCNLYTRKVNQLFKSLENRVNSDAKVNHTALALAIVAEKRDAELLAKISARESIRLAHAKQTDKLASAVSKK